MTKERENVTAEVVEMWDNDVYDLFVELCEGKMELARDFCKRLG